MGRKALSEEEKTFVVPFRARNEDRELLAEIIKKISQPGFAATEADALRYVLHTHQRCPQCGEMLQNTKRGHYICPVCSKS
jgi:hypothetical protein